MQYMRDELSAYQQMVVRKLQYAGERLIIQARQHGSYTDQTGNLRSSIGYVIVKDGQILTGSGFNTIPPRVRREGDVYNGSKEGQSLAKEIASKYKRGIALIVVAGMNYAAYVEAKGFDVLASSEMLAEKIIPPMLQKLGINK